MKKYRDLIDANTRAMIPAKPRSLGVAKGRVPLKAAPEIHS